MPSNIEALILRLGQIEEFCAKLAIVLELLDVCLRSQKTGGDLDKHKVAVHLFAEKLKTICVEHEAHFDTALKAKGNEIERLVAALAEFERDNEERDRLRQAREELIGYVAEIVFQPRRRSDQLQREINEIRIQNERLDLQRLVEQRRRSGVVDAA